MTISIDTIDNSLIISGDVEKILSNRRYITWFTSNHGSVDNNKIYISFASKNENFNLPNQDEQYATVIRLLNKIGIQSDEIIYSENAASQLESLKKEEESFKIHSEKSNKIRNADIEGDELSLFANKINKSLKLQLTEKQMVAAFHLAFSQNSCNFSAPGAGKTAMVYASYVYLKSLEDTNNKRIDKLLIISPPSAFGAWEKEFEKWIGRIPSSIRLSGLDAASRQKVYYSDNNKEIIMISYQSASNHKDVEGIKDYLQRNKVMVVLDEAHRIKSLDGIWAQAILSFAKFASSRVVLTGTPAPYGYQDLYNLYKFIWPTKKIIPYSPGVLESLTNMSTRHQIDMLQDLITSISPFFIRIRKSHMGLPVPINHKPIIVKMDGSHKNVYDYIEHNYMDDLERENNRNSFTNQLRQAKVIRLRQAASNPYLLKFALDAYLDSYGISSDIDINDRDFLENLNAFSPDKYTPPKFKSVLNLVKNIIKNNGPDGKVIIWTIFIKNLQLLSNYLKTNGINCEVLYGETPIDTESNQHLITREKIIDEFHMDSCKYKVIIANPFAVGESISLHHACRNAIYFEKDFNAGLYMQSKDRIHRMGLPDDAKVNYYHFITEDSIEETIHNTVLEREERMLEIIENEEIPLLNLDFDGHFEDTENIKSILEDYHARRAKTA